MKTIWIAVTYDEAYPDAAPPGWVERVLRDRAEGMQATREVVTAVTESIAAPPVWMAPITPVVDRAVREHVASLEGRVEALERRWRAS